MNEYQERLCSESTWDFSDVRALFINSTLKPSPGVSNTEGLARISMEIMEANGVTVDTIRAVDHDIAAGVYPDMRDHGAADDEWPALYERVESADILVLMTPIWLGQISSVCARVIERLYGNSSELNEHGQYAYYGKVGGCLITGNEDGAGVGSRRQDACGTEGGDALKDTAAAGTAHARPCMICTKSSRAA